jgi:hypothetical protein
MPALASRPIQDLPASRSFYAGSPPASASRSVPLHQARKGCPPGKAKLSIPEGLFLEDEMNDGLIYFVSLMVDGDVHVQGMGFTNFLTLFCWGRTPQEAEDNARAYLLGNGIAVKKVYGVRVEGVKQDPAVYCFPEQIYGLPGALAEAAIRGKSWGDGMIADTLATLRKKQAQLAAGRKLLAERAQAVC